MTELAQRIAAVGRPHPKPTRIIAGGVLLAFLAIGVFSFIELGITPASLGKSLDALPQFLARTTPLVWPAFEYDRATGAVTFVSWSEVWEFVGVIGVTLGIVFSGTFLSSVISVPVAYWAARNTTPNPAVMAVARTIGVVARAIPDVAFAALFVLAMRLGALPGILAIMLHSVGMISKMFADAIEQIDEGPRLAIRSTGGTRAQEFWSGVFPQVLPAWVAISLHRADINLRASVILGFVGVSGLGRELANMIGVLNYRRGIPIAITIVVLCVLFEIVSSVVRARLLGVQPSGRGIGDRIVRGAANRSAALKIAIVRQRGDEDRGAAIRAAMRRPWTGERIASTTSIWLGILVVAGSFVVADARWIDLFTVWGNLGFLGDRLWPPTFGIHPVDEIMDSVFVTVQVAFAATLISAVLVAFIGTLAARNVARNGVVRNSFRGVLLFIRGIPELILAIVLVIITGLGPLAGTVALGIAGVGLLGKLVADSLEEVPGGPERAIVAVGGSRLQVFFSSTVPYSIPAFVAHVLYLLEQNLRAAVLLGMVGGGGIGFYLSDSLRVAKYDQVLAIVLVIILLVLVVEGTAILLRRALR